MDAPSSIPGTICKFVGNVSQAHKLTKKCTHPFILNMLMVFHTLILRKLHQL
jgi:hypothetical protein